MKIIKIKFKKVVWGRQRPRGRRLDSPVLDPSSSTRVMNSFYKIQEMSIEMS